MYEKKEFFKETLCIAVSVYVSEKNSSMSGMVEKKLQQTITSLSHA